MYRFLILLYCIDMYRFTNYITAMYTSNIYINIVFHRAPQVMIKISSSRSDIEI